MRAGDYERPLLSSAISTLNDSSGSRAGARLRRSADRCASHTGTSTPDDRYVLHSGQASWSAGRCLTTRSGLQLHHLDPRKRASYEDPEVCMHRRSRASSEPAFDSLALAVVISCCRAKGRIDCGTAYSACEYIWRKSQFVEEFSLEHHADPPCHDQRESLAEAKPGTQRGNAG